MECDDGNKASSDGCSSDCKIETGYTCTHRNGTFDLCVDSTAPTASLTAIGTDTLEVSFSEEVLPEVDGTVLPFEG